MITPEETAKANSNSYLQTVVRLAEERDKKRKELRECTPLTFNSFNRYSRFYNGAIDFQVSEGTPERILEFLIEDLQNLDGKVLFTKTIADKKRKEFRMYFPCLFYGVELYLKAQNEATGDINVSCETRPTTNSVLAAIATNPRSEDVGAVLESYGINNLVSTKK